MLRPGMLFAIALLSCGGPRAAPSPVAAGPDAAIEIARAEARRGEGVETLVRWADDPDAAVRARAMRGLARVGDGASIEVLRSRVRHGRDGVAAAEALGIAGAFAPPGTVEKPSLLDGAPEMTTELVELAARVEGAERARVIEALGRVGDAGGLGAITEAIGSQDREVAIAGGIALGRLGRRAISLDVAAAKAAAARIGDGDRDVRYAMTHGLARAGAPAKGDEADQALIAALATRLGDADEEIRANALLGLTRHEARAAAGDRAVALLGDPDWRVAVEAVRLLTKDANATEDLTAVAVMVVRTAVAGTRGGKIHVLLEGLRALLPYSGNERVAHALGMVGAIDDDLGRRHMRALLLAGKARLGDDDALKKLEEVQLPDELIGGLVADALVARAEAGTPLLIVRAQSAASGRRAAALGVIAQTWAKATGDQRAQIVDALVAGIGETRPDVAGSAADAAAAILGELTAEDVNVRGALERAIADRIASAKDDPELSSSLLAAAGTAKLAAAKVACTEAHGNANPQVRLAARDCLTAITGTDPGPGVAAPLATPDGVDPATVLHATLRWTVETTRGVIVIELDGDAAPWHVATFANLANKGFYDTLLFHRVVPDFVVQGGDPTGTGWGGPGFTLPAEPSNARYDRGVVGVADAGKDTGGSQWFAMHSRAPHLEGRYTVIGRVVEGEEHIDELLVGDRIVKSSVQIDRK